MKNDDLDLFQNEILRISNAFSDFRMGDIYFRIDKNKRHFVEMICKGCTLFAKHHSKYDDSIEGSYLEIGIIDKVLNNGNKDIFTKDITNISSNSYNFSSKDCRWIKKNDTVFFYSEDLANLWIHTFIHFIEAGKPN